MGFYNANEFWLGIAWFFNWFPIQEVIGCTSNWLKLEDLELDSIGSTGSSFPEMGCSEINLGCEGGWTPLLCLLSLLLLRVAGGECTSPTWTSRSRQISLLWSCQSGKTVTCVISASKLSLMIVATSESAQPTCSYHRTSTILGWSLILINQVSPSWDKTILLKLYICFSKSSLYAMFPCRCYFLLVRVQGANR